MNELIKMEVVINGEARVLEFRSFRDGDMLVSIGAHGLYQKRSGQKLWRENITLWKEKDGSYRLGKNAVILNRNGYRLLGWADDKQNSRHNSAR